MPDFTTPQPTLVPSADLLETLLEVSLTGVILFRPVYAAGEGSALVDLAYVRLNAAAQRMLQLPERPAETFLTLYPHTIATGIFDFYRTAFETGQPGRYNVNYQHDGLDNYFHLAAQRSGPVLVVSFTDTADHDRTAVEQALRESHAREQAAHADADDQRQRLHDLFMEAPALICIFEGPEHVFKLVNPPYQQLVGDRPLLGKPIAEAMPELAGQPIFGLLDRVYQTGEAFHAHEMLVQLDHANAGGLGENYYNFVYQATRDSAGAIDGILVFAYEVTAQVLARRQVEDSRQQVQNLNEELAAANEELQAANEEIRVGISDLQISDQALRELNNGLEVRVADRTQAALAAQADAERQRQRLERLFMQAPVAICILDGPELVYELVNPTYQELFPGRELRGLPLLSALPELHGSAIWRTLQRVYHTGETHVGQSAHIPLARTAGGPLEDLYFNTVFQPRYAEHGRIDGMLVFAFEVTAQIAASQRAETLQAEVLAATQRQVQQRETLYQIFEQTPAAVAILREPEHRFEYVNVAYQQLFPDRKLLGRTVAEALPETVAGGFVDLLDDVFQTGQTYFGHEAPLLLEQPSGLPPKRMYFTFTYQAYQENGQTAGISIFAHDVTEQVRARQQREAQQQQLQALFMNAPAPIVILDGPELVFQLVNPAYQRIFPGRELLGKPLLTALPELAGTIVVDALGQVYETGGTYVAEELPLMLARHEGAPLEEIYWTFTYQARRNGQGTVEGVMVFAHDVTAQVRARRAVEEREQYFRMMADNAPAMIWVTDPAGQCTYLNQQWYAYTGQTEAEALGLGWVNAVHPDDAQAAGAAFLDANARRVPFHILYRLRRHDGHYRWAIDAGLPRFGANGGYEGIVGTVIDVHEQKMAEQDLQRLAQKLRRARDEAQALNAELLDTNQQLTRTNADLDNFIYTASHDLRAPIANIEGLLQALREQLPPDAQQAEEVQPVLSMMQGAVERFQLTIAQLTDISRLQQAHNAQPTELIDLAALVEDVRLDLTPALTAAGAQFTVDVGACPSLSFSPKNLRSIVYNLLSNAIKYRAPGRAPMVALRCHRTETASVLQVQDNGLGLDPTQQAKLFAMFQRLHDHVEGSGIGLYMVKKIVENAGGRIEVQSLVGEGSTFSVYFPH